MFDKKKNQRDSLAKSPKSLLQTKEILYKNKIQIYHYLQVCLEKKVIVMCLT